MRKFFVLVAMLVSFASFAATADARPYLHLDEAQSALRGGYGSDNDVSRFLSSQGGSWWGWVDYTRYNSYDIAVRAGYWWNGSVYTECFESYYPAGATSVYNIYDADRGPWCPANGATQ